MKKINLLFITSILALYSLLSVPSNVFACSPAYKLPTQQENFQSADAVFLAKAISVATTSSSYGHSTYSFARATTTFEVSKFWKGNIKKYVIATSHNDSGMCGWGVPVVGQEYLIYGTYSTSTDSYSIRSSSGNKLLSTASADLEILGQGKTPQEINNPPASNRYFFARNLTFGMTGEDVRELQKYLNKNNFVVSTSSLGSIGNETMYFGSATKVALTRFQTAHAVELGVTQGTGYFGPLTRALINK